jgi:hypothetical protein
VQSSRWNPALLFPISSFCVSITDRTYRPFSS